MKRKDTLITSEQAVSVVVGALLVLSIMIMAAVQYQNNVIPAQEEETEFQHNREVRGDLQQLRSNIIATSSSGQLRTTTVAVGTRFDQQFIFGFLPAVHSPNPAGSLTTYDVSSDATSTAPNNQNISITGADGQGGASNYWQASEEYNFNTSFLNYQIKYSRYQQPPTTYYENSIIYEQVPRNGGPDNTVVQSNQNIVQGKNVNIITLSGDLGTTTTQTINVQSHPVSAPSQTITVYSPPATSGGPFTVTIPTNLSAQEWCTLDYANSTACNGAPDGEGMLNGEHIDQGGYLTHINYTNVVGEPNVLELKFQEDETFTLQLSKVHLQSQSDRSVVPTTKSSYVAWRGSDRINFRENSRQAITAQVRDRYNNPVEGVDTVAVAFRSNDESDCVGDFVSGQLGGISGCPDERQPGEQTSGQDGAVTFFYDTPQVQDDTSINLQVELANNSNYGSFSAPPKTFQLNSPGTYSAPELNQEVTTSRETGDTIVADLGNPNGIQYQYEPVESQIDNNRTLRVLDARLNKSTVIKGKTVSLSLIVDNTGIYDTSPISFTPTITDENGNTVSGAVYRSPPPIALDAGEQYRTRYEFRFDSPGNYTVSIANTNLTREIEVVPKSSAVYDGSVQSSVERQSVAKIVTSYKDEIERTEQSAWNPAIPPVVESSDGTFISDAEGLIYDFGDARQPNDESLSLESNESLNRMNLGTAFENVPQQNHYTIQLNYEIESDDASKPVELLLVEKDGTVIDPNTSYQLKGNEPRQTRYFTLSQAESDYIRDHKNIYVVFTAEGDHKVDIYYYQTISSNRILDLASANTRVTDVQIESSSGTSKTNFAQGSLLVEPIYIKVTKENTGSQVAERSISLEIDNQIVASRQVTINPQDSVTETFVRYGVNTTSLGTNPPQNTYLQGYYLISSESAFPTQIKVGNPSGTGNYPPVAKISTSVPQVNGVYVPSGETAADDLSSTFTINADTTDPNNDPITHRWEIDYKSGGNAAVVNGDSINQNDFPGEGHYVVTLNATDGTAYDEETFEVALNSLKPNVQIFANPNPAPAGTEVQLDASQSIDVDGTITEYRWTVNGTVVATTADAFYEQPFPVAADYTVGVIAVDDDGNTYERTTTVTTFDSNVVANFDYTPTDPTILDTLQLDGSGSTAINGTIESYTWYVNGSFSGDGQLNTVEFDSQGPKNITLAVEGEDGSSAEISKTVVIGPPFNVDIEAEQTETRIGETIGFNSYETTDPGGIIQELEWTMGDGTTYTNTQQIAHEYQDPGTYTVTLTARGDGYEDTATVEINITAIKPIAIAQYNSSIFLNEKTTIYGENSYHPEGYINYYSWDLDNGETRNTENILEYEYASPTQNQGQNTPLRKPYNVTLTVTGNYGNQDTDYIEIEVVNRGPVANWTASIPENNSDEYEVYKGDSVQFNGSNSYHLESPKGSIQTYEWIIDGTRERTTPDINRTWSTIGSHSIALTVEDQFGAVDTNTSTVHVFENPVARLTASPTTLKEGQATEFDASLSTAGGPDNTTIDEYRWDFNGDGTTDQVTTTPTLTHAYSTEGEYNATVTIVNSDGRTDTDTVTLVVEETASNTRFYKINNPTDKSTTNYQVNINVKKGGDMDSDYGSVRFYQDGAPLDYHRVSYDATSAEFVVELNSISASGATVNMTYGGTRGTASDPEATYLVYDYHGGNGMDDGGTFYGTAYDVNGYYARLTENRDGQQGSLRYGTHDVGLKAQYEWRVRDGNGADSVNFVTFNNGNSYEHENPSGNGIHFAVVDHDNCVAVNYNGECQYTTGYSQDHNWHTANAEISETGINTGNYNYVFDSGATGAGTLSGTLSAPGVGNQFGFSGRTGGLNNYHEVRSITIRKWLGQPMQVTRIQSEFIDSFERNDMNPYLVSDSSFIYTTDRASTEGSRSLALEVPCCGETAYSNSGLPTYPERGDYITARLNFKDGYFSWGQSYGTRMSIGFGGTGDTPAYTAYIKGNSGQRLQLQADGHGTVDSTSVNWGAYEDEWLRLHIDYDAHGDGMIRVHVLDEDNNRIGTVAFHDPNGPNGGSQLYFGLVGDTNREGTVYVDEIKRTPNQIYTDDWEQVGLTNWNQDSGSWSYQGNGQIREDSSFNSNSLINPNFQMNVSEGVYIDYDTYLGGEWANYNRVYLRTAEPTTTNWMGLGHDDYNGRNGLASGFAGGDGYRITGQAIYGYTWNNMNYQYTPASNGQCSFNYPSGSASTTACNQPTDPLAQQILLGGWSHNSGDQWRNLYIKRTYSDKLEGSTPIYSHDFSSSYDGWTTETGRRTLKNGWMTAGCSNYDQTNTFLKTLGSHNADQISYNIRVAAIDSWDGEGLRFQILDDSGWNTVEYTTPSHSYGSQTSIDCHTNNDWYTSIYTWSGTYTPTGDIQAIRVHGDINQDDDDESIGIDYVTISRI